MSDTYESVSPAMREMLAAHEAFRKLGFKPDEIFVHYNPDATVLVAVHANDRDYAVMCGQVYLSRLAFTREWSRVVEAVRDGSLPQADLDRMWVESQVYRRKHSFVTSLILKGIEIPNAVGLHS